MNLFYEIIPYMQMLSYSQRLINFEEAKNIDSSLEKRKLQGAYRLRNNSFALLLKANLPCYEDPNDKDSICMEYDIIYTCRKSAIKSVLQDDFDSIKIVPVNEYKTLLNDILITKTETITKTIEISNSKNHFDNQSIISDQNSTRNNDKSETKLDDLEIPDIDEDIKESIDFTPDKNLEQEIYKKEEEIEELLKKDIEPEVPIDSNPTGPIDLIDDLDTANTPVSDSSTKSRSVDLLDEEPLKENITVKDEKPEINDIYGFINTPEGMETVVRLYNPEKSEKEKSKKQFIMDHYKIALTDIKETKVELLIIPLSVPGTGTENPTDIFVLLKSDTIEKCKCSSETNKKVILTLNDYKLVITGNWQNGKFYTNVQCTKDKNFELKQELSRFRSNDIYHTGIGHPVVFIRKKVDDHFEELRIHVLPKSINGENGECPTAYCVEYFSTGTRKCYRTKEKNEISFAFDDILYTLNTDLKDDVYNVQLTENDNI